MENTTNKDVRDVAARAAKVLHELDDDGDQVISTARMMAALSVLNAAMIAGRFPKVPGVTDDVIIKLADQTRRGVQQMQGVAVDETKHAAEASVKALMGIIEGAAAPDVADVQELVMQIIQPMKDQGEDGDRVKAAAEIMRMMISVVPAVMILISNDDGRHVLWGALKMAVDGTLGAALGREDLLRQGMDLKAARH